MIKVPFELFFKLLYGGPLPLTATDGGAFDKFLGLFYSGFCFVIPQSCGNSMYLLFDPNFASSWPYSHLNKVTLVSASGFPLCLDIQG